ncbi:CBS domain containing protein [Nitzschia inconspicua]|uniref:CBS domain containing protein n=1 Tax=Nitzschia inconspicua TaxID=303405 RepID=A0A9K3KPG3_9STRA|nr:CBS domain containing protein [Nitzschia inconspicua]
MKRFSVWISLLFGSAAVLPSTMSFSIGSGVRRVFVSTPTKANHRRVKDCMTAKPVTLKTTDTVDEAIHILLSNSFNGAPVIDPVTGNLVGVISAFDFLSKEEAGAVLPFEAGDLEEQQEMAMMARRIVATTVGDLMTEAALTVSMEMGMKEAAELMIKDRCHRLCVVDDDNNLVGVLSTSDVMKNINTVLRALPESAVDTKAEESP